MSLVRGSGSETGILKSVTIVVVAAFSGSCGLFSRAEGEEEGQD